MDLDKKVLAEVVNQVLTAFLSERVDKFMEDVVNKVRPILEGKIAQCPVCGHSAIPGCMCDGIDYICPECETELVWTFHDGKNEKNYLLHVIKDLP